MGEQSKTRRQYETRKEQIRELGDGPDVESILLFLNAYDPQVLTLEPPRDPANGRREDTLANRSLMSYASTLKRTAGWLDLTDHGTGVQSRG